MSAPLTATEYVSVESASATAGVSARTLRYWIKVGKLPAKGGKRGRLVDLAMVRQFAAIAGRLPADSTALVAGNVAEGSPLAAIERQLAEYRELIEALHRENVTLARQLGQRQSELEAARSTIALLSAPAEVTETATSQPTAPPANGPDSSVQTVLEQPKTWWRRLFLTGW